MGTNPVGKQAAPGRRVRRALGLSLGLATLAVVGALAAVEISELMQNGHPLRGAMLAGVTLLGLMLGMIVASTQLRGSEKPRRRPVLPDAAEPTGIWGVGGPSMREPGSTGNWQTRTIDRRYENSDN